MMRAKAVFVTLTLLLLVSGATNGQGALPSFIDYNSATADVTWRYIVGSDEQVVTGVFTFSLPEWFSLSITRGQNQGQKIYGYRDLISITKPSGLAVYNYESIQLFTVFEKLFGELAVAHENAVTYIDDEMVGGRAVGRYECEEQTTFWFDRETNVPLRITDEAGINILSLRQYQVDADQKQGVEIFTLSIKQDNWDGIIRINRQDGHWFPMELQVGDLQSQIIITFSNWEVVPQALTFKDLEQLDHLLKLGSVAKEAGNDRQVINYFRQILNIDPFYVDGYTQLATSYSELGNYLGAVESYQQWLMLEPDQPVALNQLAALYLSARSNLIEALDLAYRAVVLDPQARYMNTLGYGYYLAKDYEKALHYLKQAAQAGTDQELFEIYSHLILVYEALDNYQEVEYYRRELKALDNGEH